jgi:hypothetical protein
MTMNMLCLLSDAHPRSDTIWHSLEPVFREHRPERLLSVAQLAERLRPLNNKPGLVLLALPDKFTLRQVLRLDVLLRPFRVVLILPDGEDDTVNLAHRLRPRYVTDFDCESRDLCSVLSHMIRVYSGKDRKTPRGP